MQLMDWGVGPMGEEFSQHKCQNTQNLKTKKGIFTMKKLISILLTSLIAIAPHLSYSVYANESSYVVSSITYDEVTNIDDLLQIGVEQMEPYINSTSFIMN